MLQIELKPNTWNYNGSFNKRRNGRKRRNCVKELIGQLVLNSNIASYTQKVTQRSNAPLKQFKVYMLYMPYLSSYIIDVINVYVRSNCSKCVIWVWGTLCLWQFPHYVINIIICINCILTTLIGSAALSLLYMDASHIEPRDSRELNQSFLLCKFLVFLLQKLYILGHIYCVSVTFSKKIQKKIL